jgi:HEAT repeat protein
LIAVVDNRDGYYHSAARIAATHSLGQLRDLRAVVPLLNAIRDPVAEASAEAIRTLASMPDPRGLPALLEVVRNEHGFFLATTRRAAILGLAQIGGKQAACELHFVATNQWEDAVVRAAAIEAIPKGSISTPGA